MAGDNNKKENKVVEKEKSGNPMMIVLIILIVVLIGAVGFLGYVVMNNMNNSSQHNMENKKEEMVKKDEGQRFRASIEDLVLNVTNAKGREKLMKLSFSLKSSQQNINVLVEHNKDEIIDTVIQQVSSRSSEELLTVGGKELLKEELLADINTILNEATKNNPDIPKNIVKKLFFTIFVLK